MIRAIPAHCLRGVVGRSAIGDDPPSKVEVASSSSARGYGLQPAP